MELKHTGDCSAATNTGTFNRTLWNWNVGQCSCIRDISFGAAPDVDARNVAKSALIDKLDTNHIYTSSLTTDDLWGGLDSYSGDKVYDAINSARDNNRISDTVYRELMALLKKACHTQ